MRKRLRKKLRKAEFRQDGFTAEYQLRPELTHNEALDFLDRFILEAIEPNELLCGGGGGPVVWDFFVCANRRRSATDDHRRAVEEWLKSQSEVITARVGALEDAWYPEDGTDTPPLRGNDAA